MEQVKFAKLNKIYSVYFAEFFFMLTKGKGNKKGGGTFPVSNKQAIFEHAAGNSKKEEQITYCYTI